MSAEYDTHTFWLNNASRYPLLPPAQVLKIAEIIQNPETPDAKRQRAVQKLVRHNLKLIPDVVRKVTRSKRSYADNIQHHVDMMQCGVIGLQRAAELYNPKLGYRFSTYAVPWIYQAVQRFAYNNISMVRVPETTIRQLYQAIDKETYLSFDPTDKVQSRLLDAFIALYHVRCETEHKREEDSSTIFDRIIDSRKRPEMVDSFDRIVGQAKLDTQQKKILEMYYIEGLSKPKIAAALGITEEKVKGQQSKAIKKLQKVFSC